MPSAPKWLADFPIGTEDLGRMGTNKIGMYRARFPQDQVLSGGTYSNWTRLDNLAKQASLQGVTLVPILINMPGETYTPPHTSTERDQFGSFAAAAARRYGPKGSFWSSCGCPFLPVQVWEVWNEPNMAPYWDAPSAVDYAGMLQVVRSKLRAVDRAARIMVGGLAYAGSYDGVTRINPNDFLRAVIQTNGVNAFDALALHDYHSVATSGVSAIGGTVGTLKQYAGTDASGAPRQQVWINEFGKATALDDPSTRTWTNRRRARSPSATGSTRSSTACWRTARRGTSGRASGTRSATMRTQTRPGSGWASAARTPTTPTAVQSSPGTPTSLGAASLRHCRSRSSGSPSGRRHALEQA